MGVGSTVTMIRGGIEEGFAFDDEWDRDPLNLACEDELEGWQVMRREREGDFER